MNCLFAYNPVSGKGKISKKIHIIKETLLKKYTSVDVLETKQAGDLARFAIDACGKYDAFIFSGGDGSVNEVISGLAEKKDKPILGYIPTGTVNDVSRSLGIKRNLKKALSNILLGEIESFDVMKLNDRYAFYAVACGSMTTCAYMTSQKEKNKLGPIAYGLYALKHDFDFHKFKVNYTFDGGQGEAEAVLILLINSKSVSSFKINKDAILNDGKIDVVIVTDTYNKKEWGIFRIIRNLLKSVVLFLFGYKNFKKNRKMITFTTSQAKFCIDNNICWNFDGEKGVLGELNLSILQNEVKFIVPQKKKKQSK